MKAEKKRGKKLKNVWAPLLAVILLAGMLILPANAYTMNTLVATKDYFVFEGGIIKADWTKVISHVTEDGAITSKDIISYRPTVYIPLGSKITLTQDVLNQGYRMAIAQDGTAIEENLTSCAYNYTDKSQVVLYKPESIYNGLFYADFEIYVIGVEGGTAANLATPFTDISYFDERVEVVGPYSKLYRITLSDELRGGIEWAYHQGIIPETSATTFSPFKYITKAEVAQAQALWIYSGKPELTSMNQNPFEDVAVTDPYYKAILWSYENDLLPKYGMSEFKPTWTVHESQVINALNKLFHCELPQAIHDGQDTNIRYGGACSRVNAAHYFHYAHKYAGKDTAPAPNTPTTPTTPTAPNTPNTPNTSNVFTDVKSGDYYADAVKWAVDREITNGTSPTTFSPGQTCTTAQILTFLWRAMDCPEPYGLNPFGDVSGNDYYYKAALWSKENGLVEGNYFNPNTPCTRSMVVTYLWKLAGAPSTNSNSFTDVSTPK